MSGFDNKNIASGVMIGTSCMTVIISKIKKGIISMRAVNHVIMIITTNDMTIQTFAYLLGKIKIKPSFMSDGLIKANG